MEPQPRHSVRNILIDQDNWEKYKSSSLHLLRDEQIKEIDSMLLCNDPRKGFFAYYCNDCDKYQFRHFCCNSRACSKCGKYYVDKWAEKTTKRLLQVNHSHIIFTMPSILWNLIKDNFDCIKELSETAYRVIVEVMSESSKQKITPGMISSLHTYGEDMKYNVHFHTIVTNGGMSAKYGEWKNIDYLPFNLMRLKWKHLSLDVITKHIEKTPNNQGILEAVRYYQYHSGFNVKVIKTNIPKKELVRYIARYIRHPPISNRRIIDYNGKGVTIVCNKKKGYITFTVNEFIGRLIQHIPLKGFKLIRHFGLYSRTKHGKVPIQKDKQESISKYFHSKNSIPCSQCGKMLEPIGYFPPSLPEGPPGQLKYGGRITDWIESS